MKARQWPSSAERCFLSTSSLGGPMSGGSSRSNVTTWVKALLSTVPFLERQIGLAAQLIYHVSCLAMAGSPLNLKSLKEQVYAQIKGEILGGGVMPGARILEKALGARFGISRTPIREALLQLASEGLVVVLQRRGIFVAHRTLEEIEEIYALLGLLEGAAAARAIRRMGKAEIGALEALQRSMEDACERGDIRKFVEVNVQAHEVFLEACGSPRLREICAKLREQLHQYPFRMLALPGWMEKSLAEHDEILRAFAARQEGRIERMMQRHWRFKEPRREILQRLTRAEPEMEAGFGGPHLQPDQRGADHGADKNRSRGDSARQAVPERHRSRPRLRARPDPHR